MAKKTLTKPAKGTRDFLPEDLRRREYVTGVIREVYEAHGFVPLETPTFERLASICAIALSVSAIGVPSGMRSRADTLSRSIVGIITDFTAPVATSAMANAKTPNDAATVT